VIIALPFYCCHSIALFTRLIALSSEFSQFPDTTIQTTATAGRHITWLKTISSRFKFPRAKRPRAELTAPSRGQLGCRIAANAFLVRVVANKSRLCSDRILLTALIKVVRFVGSPYDSGDPNFAFLTCSKNSGLVR